MELYSFLWELRGNAFRANIISFRLLMEYHSFLFYVLSLTLDQKRGFRLLTELYSFLRKDMRLYYQTKDKFPSPYGVIFILTLNKDLAQFQNEFPSPYGVIFILTILSLNTDCINTSKKFPSPYGVSFILILFISM